MKPCAVLLCLLLKGQRQAEIHDRLTTRGHLVSPLHAWRVLNILITDGLVITQKVARKAYFHRLTEGKVVEMALDAPYAASWLPCFSILT